MKDPDVVIRRRIGDEMELTLKINANCASHKFPFDAWNGLMSGDGGNMLLSSLANELDECCVGLEDAVTKCVEVWKKP